MSLRFGNNANATRLYVGNNTVSKAYIGGTQVWPVAVAGAILSNPAATATGPTTAQLGVTAAATNGTLYLYVTTSGASAPDVNTMQSGAGAVWSGSTPVVTYPTFTSGPSGLSAETGYVAYFMHVATDNSTSAILSASFTTEAVDISAPTLSSPTFQIPNESTISATVTTDEDNGFIYWVLTTSSSRPSVSEILAGEDHAGAAAEAAGSQVVSETGVQNLFGDITDLNQDTYHLYFIHQDAGGNNSGVVATGAISLSDVTPPTVSSVAGTVLDFDAIDVSFNTDDASGTAYIVLTESSTAPSAAQVKAGRDHAGRVTQSRVLSILESGPQEVSFTNLTEVTTYYLYVVHTDSEGNDSDVETAATSFTTPSETIFYEVWKDGSISPRGNNSNSLFLDNHDDGLGGTNAAVWQADGLGGGNVSLSTRNFTWLADIVQVQLEYKLVHAENGLRVRMRTGNLGSAQTLVFDVVNNVITQNGWLSSGGYNSSITALGAGWYRVVVYIDLRGASDLSGLMQFNMAAGASDSNITNTVAPADANSGNQIAIRGLTVNTL